MPWTGKKKQGLEEEWPFVAREFENRYRGFRARSEAPDYPRVLTGIANAYNRSKGIELEPAVMIGDERACKIVLSGGSDKPLIQSRSVSKEAMEAIKRIENN